jgi:predicted PurR-regulated permease PerM
MVSAMTPGVDRLAIWILAVVASLFFLREAATLLIPIVVAVLLSYALEPVVAWLQRHHVPRLAGAALVMLTLVGMAGWGMYSLRDNVASALEMLPEAARRVRGLLIAQEGSGSGTNIQSIQEAARVLQGEDLGRQREPREEGPGGARGEQAGRGGQTEQAGGAARAPQPARSSEGGQQGGQGQGDAVSAASGTLVDLLQRGVGSIVALAGYVTVVVFLVFFLLLSGHAVRDRVIEVAGPDRESRLLAATILDDINAQIQRFLLVRLVTAVIVGVATWGVLAWMGVQNAAVWGILAGVFNSIPYFGPVIVSGGLLLVGLVQGGGLMQAIQMSGAALAITSLEGWLIEPPLMGKAERMGVLAVFLGLLLWSWLWGAWGTLLAVPMLVVIKAVADHVDALKPLGRLMAP